jgi:hypothetical protein
MKQLYDGFFGGGDIIQAQTTNGWCVIFDYSGDQLVPEYGRLY